MTIESVRKLCRALPEVTEDVKWGNDLCFCISGKMFAAVDLNPPHSLGFKCTPEEFAELVVARLPKARRPGATGTRRPSAAPPTRSRARRRR
jgi:predicted DNA-binding protein (MmcQ/YjbR family)